MLRAEVDKGSYHLMKRHGRHVKRWSWQRLHNLLSGSDPPWTNWQEGDPARPLYWVQLLSFLGMNQDSHKDSGWGGELEVTGPHKEHRVILRVFPAYPTGRTVETGFLVSKSLPTEGRLFATATQAAPRTDATDQEWHMAFLAVILVASLHFLDVLLIWHSTE